VRRNKVPSFHFHDSSSASTSSTSFFLSLSFSLSVSSRVYCSLQILISNRIVAMKNYERGNSGGTRPSLLFHRVYCLEFSLHSSRRRFTIPIIFRRSRRRLISRMTRNCRRRRRSYRFKVSNGSPLKIVASCCDSYIPRCRASALYSRVPISPRLLLSSSLVDLIFFDFLPSSFLFPTH